jgi:hypothetical protein
MQVRSLSLLPAALATSLLGCAGQGTSAPRPTPPQTATEPACGTVVSADPTVGDFRDLEQLAPALRRASVVALGEATHADGTSFALKSRLVRYLHERMGFHVLAWEAGLFSCETDPAQCLGWPWGGAPTQPET